MARTRANWPQRTADERRFRFRVRLKRPPGSGLWGTEELVDWLNQRLGRDAWAKYPDIWEGHGTDTYAIHLNDHRVIPELIELLERQQLIPYAKPMFQATLGPNVVAAIRGAIHALQGQIVEDLNADWPTVSWAMGSCTLLPGVVETVGHKLRMDSIRRLGEVDTLLSTIPAAGEPLAVVLEDEHRGAIEVGISMLGDVCPVPVDTIESLRLLLDALEEVES